MKPIKFINYRRHVAVSSVDSHLPHPPRFSCNLEKCFKEFSPSAFGLAFGLVFPYCNFQNSTIIYLYKLNLIKEMCILMPDVSVLERGPYQRCTRVKDVSISEKR